MSADATFDVTLDGFACPQVGLDPGLLHLIALEHARAVVGEFIARRRGPLMARSAGLVELVEQWLAGEDGFTTVWDLAFGDIHAGLLADDGDPLAAAAALALRLNACGHAGEWDAQLAEPGSLRFGRWPLPDVSRLQVSAGADTAVIRTSGPAGGRLASFHKSAAGWAAEQPGGLPVIAGGGLEFTLLDARALSPAAAGRLLLADAYRFDRAEVRLDGRWLDTCRAAMGLIEQAADIYVPWVGTVVKALVPVAARPGVFNSGSDRFSPGIVCLSDHCYRWPLAEMLVHEATHQYLHIAARLGPLDDGTDQTLYFSPFRNKDRPIFFIVVAYHAFANVLLFYRTARRHGFVPDREVEAAAFVEREEILARQLATLEEALLTTRALTPLGRSLWEPLHRQLHS